MDSKLISMRKIFTFCNDNKALSSTVLFFVVTNFLAMFSSKFEAPCVSCTVTRTLSEFGGCSYDAVPFTFNSFKVMVCCFFKCCCFTLPFFRRRKFVVVMCFSIRAVLRVQDWITVGKNFTRSFCRAEHYTAFSIRISSLACGQAFDYFVKFSFNFLVFSCSTQILSKIAEGMLTATSRFWHFLFDFLPTELVQPRLDFKTRYIGELHTEICQQDFMQ